MNAGEYLNTHSPMPTPHLFCTTPFHLWDHDDHHPRYSRSRPVAFSSRPTVTSCFPRDQLQSTFLWRSWWLQVRSSALHVAAVPHHIPVHMGVCAQYPQVPDERWAQGLQCDMSDLCLTALLMPRGPSLGWALRQRMTAIKLGRKGRTQRPKLLKTWRGENQ